MPSFPPLSPRSHPLSKSVLLLKLLAPSPVVDGIVIVVVVVAVPAAAPFVCVVLIGRVWCSRYRIARIAVRWRRSEVPQKSNAAARVVLSGRT